MPRIPNSNTLVGAVLDALQGGAATANTVDSMNTEADAVLGERVAERLELTVDQEWNADTYLRVNNVMSNGDIIRSLRNDIHVGTAIGNFGAQEAQPNACILDTTGRAVSVIQTVYDWQYDTVSAKLDELECLQYLSGLPLAVLAVALPYQGGHTGEDHSLIREAIDRDFGPYSGRLSRYVNPMMAFSGCQTVVGDAAHNWLTGQPIFGYTACCIYYPFGETGVMTPFDKPGVSTTRIH